MKRAALVLILTVMIGAGSCVPIFPIYGWDRGGYFPAADPSAGNDILLLVNSERQRNALPPLTYDPLLCSIAQGHAEDMASRNYFSHTSPDGKDLFRRLDEAGVSYQRSAENIAWGFRDAGSLVRRWMDSPGHRKNILGNFTKAGIGVCRGYYVLVLVKE